LIESVEIRNESVGIRNKEGKVGIRNEEGTVGIRKGAQE
jgi:hypothetical protein